MSKEITDSINSDPLLYNLFSNSTKDDFNDSRPVNWIKIPTSYLTEDGKDSSISMISVHTYSAEESQNIYSSISQPDGDDIVFSEDGHVACNFTKSKTTAEFFYPNPVVTPPRVSSRPIGISNTVGQFMKNYPSSFFFSEKFLFSKNLLWILYQLPNKFYNKIEDTYEISSKKNEDSIPVYVLLYNTIHRKNFQVIYGKILNDTNDIFSTKAYIGSNTGYYPTITKYCNAFKVKKFSSPNTGKDLEHYGDPSCALSFDPNIALLSQALSLNLTSNSWKNFYKDKSAYDNAIKSLAVIPTSEAYCSRGSSGSPASFIRTIAKIVEARRSTNSFMQILSNNQIVESGEDSGASFPAGYNVQLPSGYRPEDAILGVTCGERNLSLVDCSVNVSSKTGDISLDKSDITNYCGNDKQDSDVPVPSVPSDSGVPVPSVPSDFNYILPIIIFLILMIILILIYIFAF